MAIAQDDIDQIVEAILQTEEMQFVRQKLMPEADAARAPGEDFEPDQPIDVDGERQQVDKVVSFAKRYGLSFDEAAAKVHYRRPRSQAFSQPEAPVRKITARQVFAYAARHGCSYSDAAVSLGAR